MLSNFDPTQAKTSDVASCEKCGVTWFEQVDVYQYKTDYTSVLGQTPPPASDFRFVFLRCIGCGEKYEPNIVQAGLQNKEAKLYEALLNEMDKLKETPAVPPVVAETK